MITKKDFYKIVDGVKNAQDRMLLASVYNGIYGKQFSELGAIKLKDINLEENYIMIGNRKAHLDKEFKKIVEDTIKEDFYYKMGSVDKTNEGFNLNMDSEYLMKPKPTARNKNGLGEYKFNSLRQKFIRLTKDLGIKITPRELMRAGAINHLLVTKETWTAREIQKELVSNGFAYDRFDALKDLRIIKG